MEVPDEYGRKLLWKVGNAVKEILGDQEGTILAVGTKIVWHSPLFGRCVGKVAMNPVEGKVLVHHPLTETVTWIPVSWVGD